MPVQNYNNAKIINIVSTIHNVEETMGNKSCSFLMVLVIIISALSMVTSSGIDNCQMDRSNNNSRTYDFDNVFETAIPLSNNTTKSGDIDPADDMLDYHKIYLNANSTEGDLLTINLTLDDIFDIAYIYVYNPEKYQIMNELVWPFWDGDFLRTICACTTGNYYIVVGAYIGAFKYNLTASFYSVQRVKDDDNCNINATTVSGVSYSGSVNAVYDYLDLYSISVTSGATTTEALTVELSYYIDKFLAVYNPDGTMRDSSDRTYGDSTTKETVKFAADQTGDYIIVVGISGNPEYSSSYSLNITKTSNVPADNDYDKEHALLVYNGTLLNSSFDSEFDEFDYYMIDLKKDDKLNVSLVYLDEGSGKTDIDIYNEDGYWVNDDFDRDSEKGCWASVLADNAGRYYIEVETWWEYIGNYTILFSTTDHLWYLDKPMKMNSTNLDFVMKEDTIDETSVNLYDIFYDPDSAIEFKSTTHPNGIGENMDIQILKNGTVRFIPHQNYSGVEVVKFTATDTMDNIMQWSVKVTILPVNDAPIILSIGGIDVIDNKVTLNAKQSERLILKLEVVDSEHTEYFDYMTNISDGEPADIDFRIDPANTSMFSIVEKMNSSFIDFVPENSQVGTLKVNITVYDSIWSKPNQAATPVKVEQGNTTVEATFIIENTNDAPVFLSVGGITAASYIPVFLTAFEDQWNNYSVNVLDIDHDIGFLDEIIFGTNTTDPAFHIDSYTGEISFFPFQKHVGFFYVNITVHDINGGVTVQNLTINVININDQPKTPKPRLNSTYYLTVYCITEEVLDEDGDELIYQWDFGDGSKTATGLEVVYSYAKAGNYTITLTVNDGNEGLAVNTMSVSVKAPPDVKKPGGGEDTENVDKIFGMDSLLFFMILIIIVIIIIVAVFGVVYSSKKKQQERDRMVTRYDQQQMGPTADSGYTQPPTTQAGPPQQQPVYDQPPAPSQVSDPIQQAEIHPPEPGYPYQEQPTTQQYSQPQTAPIQTQPDYPPQGQPVYDQYPQPQDYQTQEQVQPPQEPYQTPPPPPTQPEPIYQENQITGQEDQGYSIEQKIQMLDERLIRGEISQTVYLDLKAKYEAEAQNQVQTPEQPQQNQQYISPTGTEDTMQTYIPPPSQTQAQQPPMETSFAPCPICSRQVQVGAPNCTSCGSALVW